MDVGGGRLPSNMVMCYVLRLCGALLAPFLPGWLLLGGVVLEGRLLLMILGFGLVFVVCRLGFGLRGLACRLPGR